MACTPHTCGSTVDWPIMEMKFFGIIIIIIRMYLYVRTLVVSSTNIIDLDFASWHSGVARMDTLKHIWGSNQSRNFKYVLSTFMLRRFFLSCIWFLDWPHGLRQQQSRLECTSMTKARKRNYSLRQMPLHGTKQCLKRIKTKNDRCYEVNATVMQYAEEILSSIVLVVVESRVNTWSWIKRTISIFSIIHAIYACRASEKTRWQPSFSFRLWLVLGWRRECSNIYSGVYIRSFYRTSNYDDIVFRTNMKVNVIWI